MPKPSEVMRKAHSVLSASVEPTTQAFIAPTKWKRLSLFNIPNTLTANPSFYAVTIFGEAYDYNKEQMRQVEIQRIYRAYNPILAVGSAVASFFKDNGKASITSVQILKEC